MSEIKDGVKKARDSSIVFKTFGVVAIIFLVSFNNPFNERIAESTDERAITATAERDATVETFKIDVDQIATADRFLSGNIERDRKIPEGMYMLRLKKPMPTTTGLNGLCVLCGESQVLTKCGTKRG